MLFVARGEPAEVFDAVEEPLDAVARAVERRAEAGFAAAMDHRWDVWRGTGGLDLPAQPTWPATAHFDAEGIWVAEIALREASEFGRGLGMAALEG